MTHIAASMKGLRMLLMPEGSVAADALQDVTSGSVFVERRLKTQWQVPLGQQFPFNPFDRMPDRPGPLVAPETCEKTMVLGRRKLVRRDPLDDHFQLPLLSKRTQMDSKGFASLASERIVGPSDFDAASILVRYDPSPPLG